MSSEELSVPYGYCHCGCGEQTSRAPQTHRPKGWIAGEPFRFVHGHNGRSGTCDYIVDADTGCWIYGRSKLASGYAQMTLDGRRMPAHRAYYIRAKGPIPDGLQLDHLCRNRACVNPDHLEAVTPAENVRRAPRCKLTVDAVREIKSSSERGVDLAAQFGVTPSVISNIRKGKTWKDVA